MVANSWLVSILLLSAELPGWAISIPMVHNVGMLSYIVWGVPSHLSCAARRVRVVSSSLVDASCDTLR